MALHLNLNHEQESLRSARRRDPLKLSMFGLALIVGGFVAQYFWAMGKSSMQTRHLAQANAEFATLSPLAAAAVTEEGELKQKLANSDAFLKRIEGRFYWAPLLQELVTNVPPNVQISRFAGDGGGEGGKRLQFNLDGVAAGAEPRSVAEKFRQNLGDLLGKKYRNVVVTFRGDLVVGKETVTLDGKEVPTATFGINVQIQKGDATPAPTGH